MSYTLQNWLVLQPLDDGLILARSPFFRAVSALGTDRDELCTRLAAELENVSRSWSPLQHFQHHPALAIESGQMQIQLTAPMHLPLWTSPLNLSFAWVSWQVGERAIFHFPTLGTLVLVRDPSKQVQTLQAHVQQQVQWRSAYQLPMLHFWQRQHTLEVEPHELNYVYLPPKEQAQQAQQAQSRQKTKLLVEEKGRILTAEGLNQAWEMETQLKTLAPILSGKQRQSVLLVGPSGVGKTALAHQWVRKCKALGQGQIPCWAITGSELIAGNSGFGAWQEEARRLIAEAMSHQALLFLGNLTELAEVGKGESQNTGLAELLQPALRQRQIQAVAECTPEQYKLLERQMPQLIQAFQIVQVKEPEPNALKRILHKKAESLSKTQQSSWNRAAIQAVEDLHRRFATYSAFPGRLLHFMQRMSQLTQHKPVDAKAVIQTFAQESGLPLWLLDPDQRLNPESTLNWFDQRIIGQTQASSALLDVLALLKSNLNQTQRPMASFLMVGPTGVGKTALAKALAQFLFGSEKRLLRLDMSEYQQAQAVQRLTGIWGQEGLLTARVREQPFGILLFDELEKAHPAFFDLLLQILGEGRLTDHQGRLANFCNTVILMTSNLGARELFQRQPGFSQEKREPDLDSHFVKAIQQFFRPELFNRIDRAIPFRPLSQEMAEKITVRELSLLHQRQGLRELGLQLQVRPDALAYLATHAYDIRYGARPLKRLLERQVLLPLAERINQENPATLRDAVVEISLQKSELCFHLSPATSTRSHQAPAIATTLGQFSKLRQQLERLQAGQSYREICNELYWLEREKSKSDKMRFRQWKRLESLQEIKNVLQTLMHSVKTWESDLWLACCETEPVHENITAIQPEELQAKLHTLLLQIYRQLYPQVDQVTLILYRKEPDQDTALLAAYDALAKQRSQAVKLYACDPARHENGELRDEKGQLKYNYRPLKTLPIETEKCQIFLLEITGPDALLWWQGEAGLHSFRKTAKGKRLLWGVEAKACSFQDFQTKDKPEGQPHEAQYSPQYSPPFSAFVARREYNFYAHEIYDPVLKKHLHWGAAGWQAKLADCLEASLNLHILKQLESDDGN